MGIDYDKLMDNYLDFSNGNNINENYNLSSLEMISLEEGSGNNYGDWSDYAIMGIIVVWGIAKIIQHHYQSKDWNKLTEEIQKEMEEDERERIKYGLE
tara:strand:+ start:380 stop:673 length:294 start_codon:yes stop_codon:yes gene_type:complete